MVEATKLVHTITDDPNIIKLLNEMLAGGIAEIKPSISLNAELGFTYSHAENLLGLTTRELLSALEFLSDEGLLERQFDDKILFCQHCQSPNLRPSLRCPKCGSGNIVKGRILEHFACSNIGLEDEYMAAGKYICPRCKKELRSLGNDYRSLGVNYKCNNCSEIFSEAALKWQCLKCMAFFAESEIKETTLYSYRISDEKRHWVEFELGAKARFIEYLENQDYKVIVKARVNSISKSGAEHVLDLLACRDDGFITYNIGIGVTVDEHNMEIGLEEVFRFDNKAYDLGIHDKILLAVPGLSHEAKQFARQQRIRVFEGADLEVFLSSINIASRQIAKAPFEFETKTKLVEYLEKLGYKVEQKTRVQGKSGTEYTMDIMAYNDDGVIIHTLGIGILIANDEVDIDAISLFDAKAYDISVHDKVLLVSPKLSQEAKQFAQQQRIKIIEVDDPSRLT